MKDRLLVTALLLVAILIVGLIAVSGAIILVAAPLLVYLLGSWIGRPDPVDLEMTRSLGRERVTPDEPVVVTLRVTNHGAPIGELEVSDVVPHGVRILEGTSRVCAVLDSGSTLEFSYVVGATRGSYRFARITARVAGDFPLRSRTVTTEIGQELVTLPDHRALERIPIAPRRTLVFAGTNPARQGGEGTEFYDIREHRGGESLRRVNWRASARHPDELFVNEFQQERVADVAILLDCRLRAYAEASPKSLFDDAANAAASLADALLDAGNRVGYLGYGMSLDWLIPGFGKLQKHRLLNRIARARTGDSHVFTTLESLPDRLFPHGSQVILVSPLTADDVMPLERLQMLGYAVMVVALAQDAELAPGVELAPGAAPDTVRQALRIASLQRSVLLRRLRHAGIAVIDWETSEPFEVAVTRALGGIIAAWRWRRR